eukprot:GFYU01017037.1.p1 GENE.GFYU01017037.1~~GFYU01017037.1.p1  ORF type:complete len:176 (+),score=24.02 GFYU01017037.1:33-530(+)
MSSAKSRKHNNHLSISFDTHFPTTPNNPYNGASSPEPTRLSKTPTLSQRNLPGKRDATRRPHTRSGATLGGGAYDRFPTPMQEKVPVPYKGEDFDHQFVMQRTKPLIQMYTDLSMPDMEAERSRSKENNSGMSPELPPLKLDSKQSPDQKSVSPMIKAASAKKTK